MSRLRQGVSVFKRLDRICAENTVEKSARDCYNKHIKGTTAPYKGLANKKSRKSTLKPVKVYKGGFSASIDRLLQKNVTYDY